MAAMAFSRVVGASRVPAADSEPCGETKRIAAHFYAKCGGIFYDFTDPSVRDAFDVTVKYGLMVLSLPVWSESKGPGAL